MVPSHPIFIELLKYLEKKGIPPILSGNFAEFGPGSNCVNMSVLLNDFGDSGSVFLDGGILQKTLKIKPATILNCVNEEFCEVRQKGLVKINNLNIE